MPSARRTAGLLMLVAGILHVSRIFVDGVSSADIGSTVFGVVYLAVGAALLGQSRIALWSGAIVPAIGGTLALMRFMTSHANPIFVFGHIAVYLVVISICIRLLFRTRAGTLQT